MSNCGVELIFGVKEDAISAELERRIGYYTFKATSRSRPMWEHFKGSTSDSDQRRALMMAQEIREMPATDGLLFRASHAADAA
jgi:type IV secretion system protein VirD4